METPFELLLYVSLFSAMLVAMRCYVTECRKHKPAVRQLILGGTASRRSDGGGREGLSPVRRLFGWRPRKIPVCERSQSVDEEGRRLLVAAYM